MIDENFFLLTEEFCKDLQKCDSELSSAKSGTVSREQSTRQEYQDKINSCEKKITDLKKYKADYAEYIKKVHSRFESIYEQRRKRHVMWVRDRYDELTAKVNKAKKDLDKPVSANYYAFSFFGELWNSLTDKSESEGSMKGLINTLIVISLIGALLLAGLAVYVLWYQHVEMFGEPGNVSYLFYDRMFLNAVFGLAGLNVLILSLRMVNRYNFSKNSKSQAAQKIQAGKGSRQKDLENAQAELDKFVGDYPRYFKDRAWSPPAMNTIHFVDKTDKEILEEAISGVSSPYNSSLYQPKYIFKYTD